MIADESVAEFISLAGTSDEEVDQHKKTSLTRKPISGINLFEVLVRVRR